MIVGGVKKHYLKKLELCISELFYDYFLIDVFFNRSKLVQYVQSSHLVKN